MSEFNAVFEVSELQEGAMRAVEVDGVPVLVRRSEGGETCAIANTCTHRGGLLNEGDRELGRGGSPGRTRSLSRCASHLQARLFAVALLAVALYAVHHLVADQALVAEPQPSVQEGCSQDVGVPNKHAVCWITSRWHSPTLDERPSGRAGTAWVWVGGETL